MAALTPQSTVVVGTDLTAITPTAGTGDTVPTNCRVLVRNASGAGITVTIKRSFGSDYGVARGDVTKSVAAGATTCFGGPFPADMGDPANSNLVTLTCSAVATISLFVLTED